MGLLPKRCICWGASRTLSFVHAPESSSALSSRASSQAASVWDDDESWGAPTEISWDGVQKMTRYCKEQIAVGGFSSVYLGELPEDHSPCAVKVVLRKSQRAQNEFERELNALRIVSHKNIVKLFAFCDHPDGKALVLPYHRNGSLHGLLQSKKAKETLTWYRRREIAVQIASALEYLHESCNPPLIHCDIKSANIILDDEFRARLCDLGSSRAEGTHSTRGEILMESPGYVDPFYLRTGLITASKDVYSFGVVLAELLTGLLAFDDDRNPKVLSTFLRPFLADSEKCLGVVDKRLGGNFNEEDAKTIANLAASCMSEEPAKRPTMSTVLRTLRSL